jgi:hypothetical protein
VFNFAFLIACLGWWIPFWALRQFGTGDHGVEPGRVLGRKGLGLLGDALGTKLRTPALDRLPGGLASQRKSDESARRVSAVRPLIEKLNSLRRVQALVDE